MAPLTLEVRTKRVYEPPDPRDGLRVLVDRVWPRGLTKERVRADMWLKDAAPSAALRRWFGHDRAKWDGFRRRYFEELDSRQETLQRLRVEAAGGPITLLFSARDTEHNQAVALREYLLARRPRARSARGARAARPPPGGRMTGPFAARSDPATSAP